MDQLPSEVLIRVCTYLPLKERLLTRCLSSKFRSLFHNSVHLTACRMEQKENSFIFGLTWNWREKEQKVIEIVRVKGLVGRMAAVIYGPRKGFTYYQRCNYSLTSDDSQLLDLAFLQIPSIIRKVSKTTFYCNSSEYDRLLQLYMKLFVSPQFTFNRFQLLRLNDDTLSQLHRLIVETYPKPHKYLKQLEIEMFPRANQLSPREIKFLNFCKVSRYLKLCPPDGFQMPALFWDLPFTSAKKLVIHIGEKPARRYWDAETVDTDLCIDDELIQHFIDSGKKTFVSNAASQVSIVFLINYIENALFGNPCLYDLVLHRDFPPSQRNRIQNVLLSNGFVKETDHFWTLHRSLIVVAEDRDFYIAPMPNRSTRPGYDPDQLIVSISSHDIEIVCDAARYRGKEDATAGVVRFGIDCPLATVATLENNMDRSKASQRSSTKSGASQQTTAKKEKPSAKSDSKSVEAEPSKRITERKMPKKATEDEFAKGPLGFLYTLAWVAMVWVLGFSFFSGITYIHYLRLGDTPVYFGEGTFIGSHPRILYEPNPANIDTKSRGVITFEKGNLKEKNTHNLLVRYREVMAAYNVSGVADKKDSSPRQQCGNFSGNEDGAPVESSCLVDLTTDDYGPCALTEENIRETALGFSEGQPCIMFRLSKLLGWFPDVAEVSGRDCPHPGAKRCCHSRRVTFQCTGAKYAMYPKDGMDTCAYPFWNQQDFQVPFVMLKFNLTKGETTVRCMSNLEGVPQEKNTMKFKFRMN